jgi:hypothetical protein
MEASEIWSTISAVSAAIAALSAAYSIYITQKANKQNHKVNMQRDETETRQNLSMLWINLIQVDLALDDAIREPTILFTDKVTLSVTALLRSISFSGIIKKYETIPTICEECLGYTAELQFNEFTEKALIESLSKYELDIRTFKYLVENDLGINKKRDEILS